MEKYSLNMGEYARLARELVAEGCVLIKNDSETLPVRKGDKVALFGRCAVEYYKSGLGSGGLVNAKYVVSILDAIREDKEVSLNQDLMETYEKWLTDHPYDVGKGWGQAPWSQEEMPLSEEVVEKASTSDIAIIVVGRTAGEDQDNANVPGQYLLTDTERDMIEKVVSHFERSVVVLNVGNIIDMKWVEELNPAAVLYAWQGGQEGGNGVWDVLTGRVNPSGRLTDTIARDIEDYPSTSNFGDSVRNYYQEDIYVGYRYFETFARDKVLYPFGYGLSYTTFDIETGLDAGCGQGILARLKAKVTNTGKYPGKEVVQVYVQAPQGMLGKAGRVLAGWKKTGVIQPGESQTLEIEIADRYIASFDDSGVTGYKNAFVLEAGTYQVYAGVNVRSAQPAGSFEKKLTLVEQLEEALAPSQPFQRMRPDENGNLTYEEVPLRTVGVYDRVERPQEIAYTGDKGYKLADVYNEKISMDEFLAQLSKEDLACLSRGEGMACPRVTPGTGSGFGGLTDSLRNFGIPAACTTDGPSGLRFDVGTTAFSLPNGTSLGCSFNEELAQKLYSCTGRELRRNRVDSLLGPGLNIHRNPLCGRNFEYISEDPLVAGKMGAAMVRGLSVAGSTGTIKHFCANNQEYKRREVEGIISQRALREIYLKVFEICVKEAKARSVMTTYGPVNGLWTAGSYELCTLILRQEWGFDGIVMTDWWAPANVWGQPSSMTCHAAMAAAGNDLYKCTPDASDQEQDDYMSALEEGKLTVGQLQRNAKNILGFILKSPAMLYEMDMISQEELDEIKKADRDAGNMAVSRYYDGQENGDIVISGEDWDTSQGSTILFGFNGRKNGVFQLEITAGNELDDLAQLPLTVYYDNALKESIVFRGSNGKYVTEKRDFGVIFGKTHYIKLYFGATGLKVKELRLVLKDEFEAPF